MSESTVGFSTESTTDTKDTESTKYPEEYLILYIYWRTRNQSYTNYMSGMKALVHCLYARKQWPESDWIPLSPSCQTIKLINQLNLGYEVNQITSITGIPYPIVECLLAEVIENDFLLRFDFGSRCRASESKSTSAATARAN